jgi:hypothetical protein
VLPLAVLAAPVVLVVLVVLVWAWLPQTRADDRVQAV